MMNENLKSVISYFFVGLFAALVEWIFFYLFNGVCGLHYEIATAAAIIISTFANWIFGRLLTFRNAERKNVLFEILKIYAVSAVGLLLNLLLMRIFIEKFGLANMISKIIATGIVFSYNYLIRKFLVYKKS